jgi:hypothetical protein
VVLDTSVPNEAACFSWRSSHIYYDRQTGTLRCGGLCQEGYRFKDDTSDGQPVCVRTETMEEQLDRIEKKLDQLLPPPLLTR